MGQKRLRTISLSRIACTLCCSMRVWSLAILISLGTVAAARSDDEIRFQSAHGETAHGEPDGHADDAPPTVDPVSDERQTATTYRHNPSWLATANGSLRRLMRPAIYRFWEFLDRVAINRSQRKPLLVSDVVYFGPATGDDASSPKRVFGCRLLMLNPTETDCEFDKAAITLFADGVPFSASQLQLVPANYNLPTASWISETKASENEPAMESVVVRGRSWRDFGIVVTGLPATRSVPGLRIEISTKPGRVIADVSEQQSRELTIQASRSGPAQRCLVLRVSGVLNTVNVQNLVGEINRAANSVNRVVLAFNSESLTGGTGADSTTEIAYPLLSEWLQSIAGTTSGEENDGFPFPSITSRISELHISGLKTERDGSGTTPITNDELRPRRSGLYGPFLHQRDDAAIVAACADAYATAPLDEVILDLRTGEPAERMSALVGAAGRFPVETLPLVLAACRDTDPLMQQAGMIAAGHFGEPAAISYLSEIATAGEEPAASAAVAALARSRFQVAHAALLRLLTSAGTASRSSWVRVLAKYPKPIWSEPLRQIVSQNSASESPAALRALAEVGHPELNRILQESLASSIPELQSEAFRLLVSRTDRESESAAVKYAMQRLTQGNVTVPMLDLFNRCKPPEAVPALLAVFDRCEFKSQLIETLFLLGHRNVIEPLVARMPSMEPHERGAVLNGLQRFDPPLFRKLAREALLDSDSTVAAFAVQGLQDDGTPASVHVLIEVFEADPAPAAWGVAGSALAAIGSSEARLALLRARATGNPERRSAAANMLRQIQQRSPGYRHVFEAQRFSQQEKWPEAIEQLSLAIKLDDQLGDAFAERGSAYIRTGDLPAASLDFQKALELDPYSPSAVTGSCVVSVIKDGQLADAVERLESRRIDFPNNPLYTYNAACVYGRCVEWLQQHPAAPSAEEQKAKYIRCALDDLERCAQQGYQDFDWMRKDPDLKSLHGNADFEKLTQPAVTPPAAG